MIVTGTVQNDKGETIPILYFGKQTPDGIEGIGRCPVQMLKGITIDSKEDEKIYH